MGAPYFSLWAQYGLLSPYFACAQYGLLAPYFALWAQYGLWAPGVALRLPRAVFWRPFRAYVSETPTGFIIPPRHSWRGGGRQAGGEVTFPLAKFLTSAVGRCLLPLAKFLTSAVGRCLLPLAIHGEGVADRSGVRSKINGPGAAVQNKRNELINSSVLVYGRHAPPHANCERMTQCVDPICEATEWRFAWRITSRTIMQGIHLFTIKGIPVSFQPMFILLILILSVGMPNPFIFGACAILGVLIHEFGHALTAKHFHLNPEVTLCGLGGLTTHARPNSPKQDFLITLAGPMAGLVVAGVIFGILFLVDLLGFAPFLAKYQLLAIFLSYTMYINLIWGIFNLLPVRPMDGSKVFTHLLAKITKPERAVQIISIFSFVLAVGMIVYFALGRNMFMIIISIYFAFINFNDFMKAIRGSGNDATERMKRIGIQAEALYEKGLVAARAHDWRKLEMLGHQMKLAADGRDQIARAYELLTIACTNLGKYDEALEYAPRAKQTDAVKQATARCKSLTQ